MKTSNYTYLLANPQKITSEDRAALDLLINKYPYFQSARALQLKGLKNQDSYLYNDALKRTAAHTTDRNILFEYITSEKFIQNEISNTILQHDASVDEINVIAEDVSEQISLEIDKQLKAERQKAAAILNPELFQRKVDSVSHLAEKEKEPDETLNTDKPLEFTKNDTHSFSEWLKLTKVKPIERTDEATKNEKIQGEAAANSSANGGVEKNRRFQLIDKFIQERPKITPPDTTQKNPEPSIQQAGHSHTPEMLMTETLAKVYLQQKNYKKAIQAYKILILKNPEKSGFFADQIRAIEKLQENQSQ